jgi:hypothetical protein
MMEIYLTEMDVVHLARLRLDMSVLTPFWVKTLVWKNVGMD